MKLSEREKNRIKDYWHTDYDIPIERKDYYLVIFPRFSDNALRGIKFHNKKTGEETVLLHPDSDYPLKTSEECIRYLNSISGEEIKEFQKPSSKFLRYYN